MYVTNTDDRVQTRSWLSGRLLIALLIAGVSLMTYLGTSSENPVTGKVQRVAMTVDQEIVLGLQAAPEMADQFGGLSSDEQARARVTQIGNQMLGAIGRATPYEFHFHLLADPNTVNAFALPGGQVFITEALYRKLSTEGQLAGVLGHEIGHVLERHSAQQLAKARLTEGLTGAAVLATYDPNNPNSQNSAAVAALIGQVVTMKFSRTDELQSDEWGVNLTAEAGYDPRAMIRVMEILRDAAGNSSNSEFFSTHPNPENRIPKIQSAIDRLFPQGVPAGLKS